MTRWLCLSLGLNLVLVILAAVRLAGRGEAPVPRPLRATSGTPFSVSGRSIPPIVATNEPGSTPWSRLESQDPRELIAALRAIGCPERTIRDLVVFRTCRRHRAQLLTEEAQNVREWDYTRNREHRDWRERNARRNELRDTMLAELEELLGENFNSYRMSLVGWAEPEPDFLPIGKRREVRELETRYRREIDALEQDAMLGLLDPEGAERLVSLRRAHQAEIAALLSPAEAEAYLFRESTAARYVRQRLPAAKSEAEFQAIVRLAAELEMDPNAGNDALTRFGGEPLDEARARKEAERQAEFDRRLAGLLGEERVSERAVQAEREAAEQRERERQRAQAEARAMMTEAAAEVGVAAEDAGRFFDRIQELEKTLEARIEARRQTLEGSAEERERALKAIIQSELEQEAVQIMGERGREFVDRLTRSEK